MRIPCRALQNKEMYSESPAPCTGIPQTVLQIEGETAFADLFFLLAVRISRIIYFHENAGDVSKLITVQFFQEPAADACSAQILSYSKIVKQV